MRFFTDKEVKKELSVLGVVILAGVWRVWPLVVSPTDSILNGDDGVFISWTVDTVTEKLMTFELKSFWDGNILFPHNELSLAFSDIYLPQAIASIPFKLLVDEPIALANLQTILGCILTLLALYWLGHEVSNHRGLAVLGSLAFGFSGFYAVALGHMHSAHVWGIPLSVVCLIKVSQKKQLTWLVLWWMCFTLQTLSSFITGFFVLLPAVVWLLADRNLRKRAWQLKGALLLNACVSLGLFIIATLPYFSMSRIYTAVRSIRDTAHFALSVDSLVTKYWSPSLFALIVVGIVLMLKRKRPEHIKLLLLAAGIAFLLALGPVLKWRNETVKILGQPIPLPYSLLYYIVPGFKGIRAVERWIYPAAMLMTVVGVYYVSKFSKKTQLIAVVLVGVGLLLELKPLPTAWAPARADYPKLYWWLKDQPDGVVLELPIARWGEGDVTKQQIYVMLYQTLHGKTLVNGYSGFSPPAWEEMVYRLREDSEEFNETLRSIRPRYIVAPSADEELRNKIDEIQEYELVYEDQNYCAFSLR